MKTAPVTNGTTNTDNQQQQQHNPTTKSDQSSTTKNVITNQNGGTQNQFGKNTYNGGSAGGKTSGSTGATSLPNSKATGPIIQADTNQQTQPAQQ